MTTTENILAIEVRKENLPEADALVLERSFTPFFQEAQGLKIIAESIIVTDVSQTDLITKAREMRLKMKSIRTSTEYVRKELKAESLRRGKAIDGMANIIKFLIEPIEQHLEKQENFVVLQQQAKIDEVKAKRIEELAKHGVDATLYPDLGTMPDDLYEKLVQGAELSFRLKKEAEENLRKEQEAAAKKKAAEDERIRLENIALKKKADEERIAREKLEKEKKDREEAEEKERKRLAKEAKKAAAAPDKEKMETLAQLLDEIPMPEVSTEDAKVIMNNALNLLIKVSLYLRSQAANL
jgi:hypothetical protein